MKVNWLNILFAFIAGYLFKGMMQPQCDKIYEGYGGEVGFIQGLKIRWNDLISGTSR